MSRTDLDVELYAGDPLRFTVSILNSDGTVATGASTGAGWSAAATVRVDADLASLFAFLPSGGASDGTTSIAAGVITFYATPTQTLLWASWPALDVGYDVLVTPPTANPAVGPLTLGAGRIRVHRRFT